MKSMDKDVKAAKDSRRARRAMRGRTKCLCQELGVFLVNSPIIHVVTGHLFGRRVLTKGYLDVSEMPSQAGKLPRTGQQLVMVAAVMAGFQGDYQAGGRCRWQALG